MRLFIAEKPSVARAIAGELGVTVKPEGFIEQVTKANTGSVSIACGKGAVKVPELHKCMACDSSLSRRASTKKKGMFWWGCANYPTCGKTYPDLKGKPDYNKGKAN
jgi:DNA topoisomerase-3